MSAASKAFFTLDRLAVEEVLMIALKNMDNVTLLVAVHNLISTYDPSLFEMIMRPCLLQGPVKPNLVEGPVKPTSSLSALAEAVFDAEAKDFAAKQSPKDELVQEDPEMRKATDKNINRLMKEEGLDDIQAWIQLRCLELEDGPSICCTEDCSDREEADEDLVEAVRRGKKKRLARRDQAVSNDEELAAKESPKDKLVQEEPEMREASEENIRRLMKEKHIHYEEAFAELRYRELEDGASICCSEECSDRDEADEDLCAAYRRGDEKRAARHRAEGKPVWKGIEEDEAKDSVVLTPYVAPPKVRDAELNWPFMRCKNVVKALQRSQAMWRYGEPPKNHHGLLEYIAKLAKLDVETLKKTSPHDVFKGNYNVLQVLGKSSRW